jgi:epoxyqueuosine reductase
MRFCFDDHRRDFVATARAARAPARRAFGDNGGVAETMTARVKELCREAGFPLVGVARAVPAEGARAAALAGLGAGRFAEMRWMDEDWVVRATDPGRFLEGARSLVVVALPAHAPDPADSTDGASRGVVARYARGRDYHRVFESRLRRVVRGLREELGAGARATVDYGPLLERPYAAAAGLGWLGKSTMLLAPGFGPWVLLGVIATTLELEPDRPLRKSCGACRRCIVACPTGAIAEDGGVVDSRRCISYLTIEHRRPIARELRGAMGGRVFGCDDCLDACPVGAGRWESDPELAPASAERAWPELRWFIEADEAAFGERYRGTALMRAKRDGMARNACIALGNVGTPADVPVLVRALDDGSALVRGHAAWALGRLGARHRLDVRAWLEGRASREADAWVRKEIALALEEAARPVADAGLPTR